MIENQGVIYEYSALPLPELAKSLLHVSSETLQNKKVSVDELLVYNIVDDGQPSVDLKAQSEAITIELYCRSKGHESDTYRRSYYEGDIVRKRLNDYQGWCEQMKIRYGANWKQIVPADEQFVWKEFTAEELNTYKKYLEIREKAGLPKMEISAYFDDADLPNPLDFFFDVMTNLRKEIKQAFPHVSDALLNEAMKDLNFDFFEVVALFSLAFAAMKDLGSAITLSLKQESTDVSQDLSNYNKKFEELVKEGIQVVSGILKRMNIKNILPVDKAKQSEREKQERDYAQHRSVENSVTPRILQESRILSGMLQS